MIPVSVPFRGNGLESDSVLGVRKKPINWFQSPSGETVLKVDSWAYSGWEAA